MNIKIQINIFCNYYYSTFYYHNELEQYVFNGVDKDALHTFYVNNIYALINYKLFPIIILQICTTNNTSPKRMSDILNGMS